MNLPLDALLEAILFWKAEPMTLPELCRAVNASSGEVKKAVQTLKEKLQGRGIALVQTDDDIALATAPETHELIERLRKEEISRDLGKAALQTLSIVLYKGTVARKDIEYIRGVNSTAILRSLLIRGLVERKQNESDERMFLYRPTVELLSLLGVKSAEELPEFTSMRSELEVARSEKDERETPAADEDA